MADAPESLRPQGEALIPTEEFRSAFKGEAERLSNFVPSLKGSQLQPMIIALRDTRKPDGKRDGVLIGLGSFPEGDEKRKLLFATGMETGKRGIGIVAAFLAAEAWMKRMTPAEGWRAKKRGVPRPSTAPDRQETVVLWGRTIDGRVALGMAPIQRGEKETVLGEWRFADGPDDEVQDNLVQYFFAGYLLAITKKT